MDINLNYTREIRDYLDIKKGRLYHFVHTKALNPEEQGTKVEWIRFGIPFIEMGASLLTIAGRVSAIFESALKGLWNIITCRAISTGLEQILVHAPRHTILLPIETLYEILKQPYNIFYAVTGEIRQTYREERFGYDEQARVQVQQQVLQQDLERIPQEQERSVKGENRLSEETLQLYRSAANLGDIPAQIVLAEDTLNQIDNKLDATALIQYALLAEQGNPGAMWLAGYMFFAGLGIEQNFQSALREFTRLAQYVPKAGNPTFRLEANLAAWGRYVAKQIIDHNLVEDRPFIPETLHPSLEVLNTNSLESPESEQIKTFISAIITHHQSQQSQAECRDIRIVYQPQTTDFRIVSAFFYSYSPTSVPLSFRRKTLEDLVREHNPSQKSIKQILGDPADLIQRAVTSFLKEPQPGTPTVSRPLDPSSVIAEGLFAGANALR